MIFNVVNIIIIIVFFKVLEKNCLFLFNDLCDKLFYSDVYQIILDICINKRIVLSDY